MDVSAGGAVVGAEPGASGGVRREPDGTRGRTRREAGRGLLATVTALGLAPLVAASRPGRNTGGTDTGAGAGEGARAGGTGEAVREDRSGGSFNETYHGRHIQGAVLPAAGRAIGDREWEVTVDGHPLHLMRRADGTWLTMLDHYSSYRTPLEATRAAVDELGPGERLRALGPVGTATGHTHLGDTHMGGGRGVRA